ncbi:hypothetical protein Clacol_007237 [Clathrus columnatus]|uniref:peptidylprolyl isomerase n=1 Tax=Clathrus columnatus TaxID=1419009 RepID=A0AAV5AED1_9AGAM|nr:hypothetical protein Clacol_007237 [Clathrus columnatus]
MGDSLPPNVFMDIEINQEYAGRIVFRLYDDITPRTSRNFRELATGVHGFGYANSIFHRVADMRHSAFPTTNLAYLRARTEALIQTHPKRNVVFGEVIQGMDIVYRIQSYVSDHVSRKPSAKVVVSQCGVVVPA